MNIKIKTRPYGEIEISEAQVIEFPDGIPGFDFVKKFALLDTKEKNSPFKWLQAVDEPELAFIIISPYAFFSEYRLDIPRSDFEAVDAGVPDDLLIFCIVTIPADPSEMTANLQGPVIINPSKKIGRQAISLNDDYSVRYRIVDELKKKAGSRG